MNKKRGTKQGRQKRTSVEALEGLLGGHLASADLIKDATQQHGSIELEIQNRWMCEVHCKLLMRAGRETWEGR